tara:strand:- start:137 stop:949 length:813 start_codon:yes stop_codon:yes gene_type:complete
LSPEATLRLRFIAEALSNRIGCGVDPVSARYSDRIAAEQLEGVEADVLKSYLKRQISSGDRSFLVLPLFFGESDALVAYIPKVFGELREELGDIRVSYARPLVDLENESDDALARILVDSLREKMDTVPFSGFNKVLLLDHGSPRSQVAACRDLVGRQMSCLLGESVSEVIPCSMERRDGEEYDFNEPLLGRVLEELDPRKEETLWLSYLFLFPGRHAGAGGDIDQICEHSPWFKKGGMLNKGSLVGELDGLVGLLESRYQSLVKESESF